MFPVVDVLALDLVRVSHPESRELIVVVLLHHILRIRGIGVRARVRVRVRVIVIVIVRISVRVKVRGG